MSRRKKIIIIEEKESKKRERKKIIVKEGPVETLIGPVEIDILQDSSNHKIILLGDKHVNKVKCEKKSSSKYTLNIMDYLEKVFMEYEGKEYIDFFLEIGHFDHIREQYSISLAEKYLQLL